jgi:hypothetical protein
VRNETKSERKDIGSGSEGKKSSETRKPMKHRSSVAHLPYLTNQEDPPASLLHLPLSAEAGNTPLVSPWPTLRFLSHTQSNRQKNVERETKKAASFVVSGLPSSSIFAERGHSNRRKYLPWEPYILFLLLHRLLVPATTSFAFNSNQTRQERFLLTPPPPCIEETPTAEQRGRSKRAGMETQVLFGRSHGKKNGEWCGRQGQGNKYGRDGGGV